VPVAADKHLGRPGLGCSPLEQGISA